VGKIIPPDEWKAPVIIIISIFIGLGFYTLRISKAASYLSDESKTCVNYHIIAPQYATWSHSSHRDGEFFFFLLYSGLSVLLGFTATYAGNLIIKII
jgi:hypothetical protein